MLSHHRLYTVAAVMAGLSFGTCTAAQARTSIAPRASRDEHHIVQLPSGGAWTTLAGTDTLTDSTYATLDGTRTDDGTGCVIPPTQDTFAPDGPETVEEQEVAIDLSTCEVVMQSGTPPASVLDATLGDRGTPDLSGREPARPLGGGSTATTTQIEYAAWWQDNTGTVVNEVAETLNWTDDGVCVAQANDWAVWFPHQAGWTEDEGAAPHATSCDAARVTAKARFSNSDFCAGATTYNEYTALDVAGLPGGRTQAGRSGVADGSSCANQESLHVLFHRDFTYSVLRTTAPAPEPPTQTSGV